MNSLYSYQEYGVDWLINNGSPEPKHSLLGDDMGLGKTAQMIVAAERLKAKRILVLCPATIKINWMREFHKWSNFKKIFIVESKGSISAGDCKIPLDAEVVILNYDLVIRPKIKQQLAGMDFTIGIMDEVHYLQSLTSKRTKAVLSKSGVIWRCEYKWAATGTFMPNRPKNIYPLVRSLAPYVISPYLNYTEFAYRYCGAYMGAFGLDDSGCSRSEELGDRLKPFMLRRLKEEVLLQLPEKTIQYVYLEHTPKVKKALELEQALSEEEIDAILEFKALGNQARIRHELALAKMDQCVKHIKDQMLTLNKVVVGFYHKEVLQYLKSELESFGICIVTGGMTGPQKQEQIDEFVNNPNKKIFLGQIQAAGVGVDGLQLVCSDIIFVETSWVPGDIDQFVDRCRRIGQKNNVHVQFLTVPDSLEEKIIGAENNKRKNIKSVMSRVENVIPIKVEEEKEDDMSLENEIARVANALEEICGYLAVNPTNVLVQQDKEATENFLRNLEKGETPVVAGADVDHEKERLVAYAKQIGVSGKVGAMSVENLKKKITEMEAHKGLGTTPEMVNTLESPVVEQPVEVISKTATDAQVQKAAQDLVKKIGPQDATKFVQEIIGQIGGLIQDPVTGMNTPAKLNNLSPEQKAIVLDAIEQKTLAGA